MYFYNALVYLIILNIWGSWEDCLLYITEHLVWEEHISMYGHFPFHAIADIISQSYICKLLSSHFS